MEGILFEQVEYSRQDWKVKHSISEILTVVMCGVSAGERSIYGIRAFARLKEQWLRKVIGLKLPNGLPSYDTVRRVLGLLDPKQFLRTCLKSSQKKCYEGQYDELQCCRKGAFAVLPKSPLFFKPCKTSLYNPPLWNNFKSIHFIAFGYRYIYLVSYKELLLHH